MKKAIRAQLLLMIPSIIARSPIFSWRLHLDSHCTIIDQPLVVRVKRNTVYFCRDKWEQSVFLLLFKQLIFYLSRWRCLQMSSLYISQKCGHSKSWKFYIIQIRKRNWHHPPHPSTVVPQIGFFRNSFSKKKCCVKFYEFQSNADGIREIYN